MKIKFSASTFVLPAAAWLFGFLFAAMQVRAQRIAPAPAESQPIIIRGGTIHVGNGTVIENGLIKIDGGKIVAIGSALTKQADDPNAKVIMALDQQIYPGLIAPNTTLGLTEIDAVRSTQDQSEAGTYNPGVRAMIAYNTDSRIIPTVRFNGVLLAQSTPQGGIISGASSIMQLDAWNWEDAAYKADDGIHLNWPAYFRFDYDEATNTGSVTNNEDYEKQVNAIQRYFIQAKAYNQESTHVIDNINFVAMKGLFDGSKTLFVHCGYVKEIISAVQFAKEMQVRLVVVGANDAYLCTDVLKENHVGVVLSDVHALPDRDEDNVELPYERAALLDKAGVDYCLSVSGSWQTRNLPFMAGTTAEYGVSKEDALKSITGAAARILGIDDRTGTIAVGKDANIIISKGDVLDMKTNNLTHAFIQGREINLDNAQKQLYELYMKKYGLK